MPLTTGISQLTFRQDYFGDPAAFAGLVALLHETFGIDVSLQDRFGGPDPTSMPFAYFDESKRHLRRQSQRFFHADDG